MAPSGNTPGEENSIGSAGSLAARQKPIQPRWNDDALTGFFLVFFFKS